MQDFRKLQIWENSHELTLEIYKVTKSFPKEELFGLTSQIRRSTSSIPTNISEGCVKSSQKEFSRYLYIALGSASETEYLILLCYELNYLTEEDYIKLLIDIQKVKKMLISLILKMKSNFE
jgi:four helix bundle protein